MPRKPIQTHTALAAGIRRALAAAFTAAVGAALLLPTPAAAQEYRELSSGVQDVVSVAESTVALVGVRVVDGTGSPAADDQTVVIERGRIAAVGPAGSVDVPADARVLELPGHTVIPGLVGLHDHTFYTTSRRKVQSDFTGPRLYLASGVTTVRTTGSIAPYNEINLKRSIEAGETPGPRMVITGPYITGESGGSDDFIARSPEDARRVVNYWAAEGVDWFKFYTSISRAAMEAAIEEAHRRGAKFTGHLCSVGFREAVALGIDNLEHGFITNSEYSPDKQPDECPSGFRQALMDVDLDGEQVQATIRDMVENDVAMTTTPAVYELFVPNRPPLEQRVLDAMSPATREEYLTVRERIAETGQGIPESLLLKSIAFDRKFHDAGGLLAAGVDPTGNGGALFGYGDQRNYELLIEGGFEPLDAIRVMTLNGARVLEMDDEIGSIEAGKAADLVVIEGDPLARPAEIRNVRIVFKDGVGYDSAELIDAVEGQVGVR